MALKCLIDIKRIAIVNHNNTHLSLRIYLKIRTLSVSVSYMRKKQFNFISMLLFHVIIYARVCVNVEQDFLLIYCDNVTSERFVVHLSFEYCNY